MSPDRPDYLRSFILAAAVLPRLIVWIMTPAMEIIL